MQSKNNINQIDIFELVQFMAALIRAEQRKKCTQLKISLVHFEVLDYLSQSNQYTDTPAATATYFGMTRGTVSQSLIVLEKKGYIEKNNDEIDKRIVHVQLLPPGLDILKKARTSELLTRANDIFSAQLSAPVKKNNFVVVLNALQKATKIQPFKAGSGSQINSINKANAFEIIESIAALIRSEERKRCTVLKLQLVHFQVLEYLSFCNKYSDTPAAIANYLGMTRGTVSQTLIMLEKKGWIEKQQDLQDKRVFHILLLAEGSRVLVKAKPTELFFKVRSLLAANLALNDNGLLFVNALIALQKANGSNSFGVCNACKNFTKVSKGFFCELTQEKLEKIEIVKVCQEYTLI